MKLYTDIIQGLELSMHVLIVDTLNSQDALNACAVCLQPVPTVTAHEDPDK